MTNTLVDTLLKRERAGWDSLCASTGSEFYGAMMLPDAVMVLANGMVMDRETVVQALSDAPPWHRYEISDARCVPIDETTAVLVYTGTAYRDGAQPAFRGVMSSVYHRTDDDWRLGLYQQTQLP